MIFGWTAILKDTQQFLLPAIVTCRSGALLKFDVQRNGPNGETTSGYGTIFLGFHPFEPKITRNSVHKNHGKRLGKLNQNRFGIRTLHKVRWQTNSRRATKKLQGVPVDP
jgi:hypothetical protein